MKLPPAVKLLRSEVSPCGEVGKLNFTLREAQSFTMAQAITSHRHSRYFTKTSFCRFAFCGISCLIWRNCVPTDLNHLNATVRWTVARWVGTQRHLNFCPFPAEAKMQTNLAGTSKNPERDSVRDFYLLLFHSSLFTKAASGILEK